MFGWLKKSNGSAKEIVDPNLKVFKVALIYNGDTLFPRILNVEAHNEDEAIKFAKNHIADFGRFGRYVSRERIFKRLEVKKIVEVVG